MMRIREGSENGGILTTTTRWQAAPEGTDEQDRILVHDFSPKHLRHIMALLTEEDQLHVDDGATLVLVSMEGHQQSVLPFSTGAQQPFARRDPRTPRVFANGVSQLAASRQMTSVLLRLPCSRRLLVSPAVLPYVLQGHLK